MVSDEVSNLQAVLKYCFEFSETMLIDSGEFYPFAAVVKKDGTFEAIGLSNGEEHPSPAELYSMGESVLRRRASSREIIAAALAVNVNIPVVYSPTYPDGVRVALESQQYSRFVYRPYRIGHRGFFKKKRVVEFSEMIPVGTPASFFSG